MKKSVASFLDDLKFFLSIYIWPELWLIVAATLSITAFWLTFAYALGLPNPARSLVIWLMILGLFVLVPKALTSISKEK